MSDIYEVRGTVFNAVAAGVARKVALYRRNDCSLVASTISDATTGAYNIPVVLPNGTTPPDLFVVCLPDTGENSNAKIFDRVNLSVVELGATNDQHSAYVTLLMNMNGPNNTFIDEKGNAVTLVGDVTIVSSPSKFGGSACFDGINSYLTIPDAPGLQVCESDFTIECWINRPTPWVKIQTIMEKYSDLNSGFSFQITETGLLRFVLLSPTQQMNALGLSPIPIGEFVHVAASKSGNVLRVFINGVSGTPLTLPYAAVESNAPLWIGNDGNASVRMLFSYLEDIRITKGVARYTENFTPPTTQFAL